MGDIAGFKIWDVGDCQTDSSIKMCIYGAMGTKDWRQVSIKDIRFDKKDLQNQLIPVLKKNVLSTTNWADWTSQLLEECTRALGMLFPLRENEITFLRNLFEHGILDASLLAQDPTIVEKIASHPLLQWKAQLVSQNIKDKADKL